MTDHDRYLARYSMEPMEAECPCGLVFGVTLFSEYGQSWFEPEECPGCSRDVSEQSMTLGSSEPHYLH